MGNKFNTYLDEAALEYAREHSSAPDKETPDWIITDFKAGADLIKQVFVDKLISELKKKDEQIKELADALRIALAEWTSAQKSIYFEYGGNGDSEWNNYFENNVESDYFKAKSILQKHNTTTE